MLSNLDGTYRGRIISKDGEVRYAKMNCTTKAILENKTVTDLDIDFTRDSKFYGNMHAWLVLTDRKMILTPNLISAGREGFSHVWMDIERKDVNTLVFECMFPGGVLFRGELMRQASLEYGEGGSDANAGNGDGQQPPPVPPPRKMKRKMKVD